MDQPARHPKYRTKLCRNYMSGQCAFGPKCSFIHPPPGLFPPYYSSSPFARQLLLNWNALLPRMMAFSQAMQPVQTKSSAPQFQGPFLVDEDPSLLSTTDAVNSGPMKHAQLRTPKQRVPCRHFVRTGGWCPAGGQCKFVHDYSAIQYPTPSSTDFIPDSEDVSDMYSEDGRTISGGVRVGAKPFSQNSSQAHPNETLSHAQGVRPYPQPYTSSWYLPSQSYPQYPHYYAFDPVPLSMPMAVGAPEAVAIPPSNSHTPPDPTESPGLPTGTYEMNGTTYFPPLQAFAHESPPVPSLYYDQSANYIPAHNSGTEAWYPVEPPVSQPYLLGTNPSPLNATRPSDLRSTASPAKEVNKLTTTQENEFPYRPPKNQRVGHARRISVNIKKSSGGS